MNRSLRVTKKAGINESVEVLTNGCSRQLLTQSRVVEKPVLAREVAQVRTQLVSVVMLLDGG